MAEQQEDKLAKLLADGWAVAGYSTTIMAAGAMTHSILLQKDASLIQATVIVNSGSEIGRVFTVLSPMPLPKKGWFS
jgi:hypothetical protein